MSADDAPNYARPRKCQPKSAHSESPAAPPDAALDALVMTRTCCFACRVGSGRCEIAMKAGVSNWRNSAIATIAARHGGVDGGRAPGTSAAPWTAHSRHARYVGVLFPHAHDALRPATSWCGSRCQDATGL